jgi:hypothetical protein
MNKMKATGAVRPAHAGELRSAIRYPLSASYP